MTRVRQTGAWLLIAVISSVALRFLTFQCSVIALRQDFRSSILRTHSIAERFVFNPRSMPAGVEWQDGKKEIRIDGRLYDVVDIINDGVSLEVRAIADSRETELFENFFETERTEARQIMLEWLSGFNFTPSEIARFIIGESSFEFVRASIPLLSEGFKPSLKRPPSIA